MNPIACGNRVHVVADYAYDKATNEIGMKERHVAGGHHHWSVAEVKECFAATAAGRPAVETIEEALQREAYDEWEYQNDPDRAYERHLENQGETFFTADGLYEEEYYAGAISFEAGMKAAEARNR